MTSHLARRTNGQALVVFLGFAAAMIGMMLVSFNSGQVTNAKMRAMNAADAAAYSGAEWQARSLNFQAYMNRAMVVNEVTIAQSVSLRSWVDYLARFISNINLVAEFIPYVGEVSTAISKALDEVDEVMETAMPLVEQGARALNVVEQGAQEAFYLDGALSGMDIAVDIAKRNGAQISTGGYALMALNEVAWMRFTDTYTSNHAPAGTSGDGRKRLRAVTLDSRDGFTQSREWNWSFPLNVVKVDKQGGTDLVDYDAWKGLDSVAMCTGLFKCPWVPLGWGGGQAANPNQVAGIGTHGNSGDWKRKDGLLARTEANAPGQVVRLAAPFPNYRDLNDLDTSRTAQQKIPFAVEVIVTDKNVKTAASTFGAKAALIDGTQIDFDPQYAATQAGVYGLAEACVSFERPFDAPRVDGGVERPSLFNPYWRASLATPSKKTRIEAGLSKGLPSIDALLGGAGSCG